MKQGVFPHSSSEMEKSLYDAALNNDVPTLVHLLTQDPNLLERTNFQCEDKNPLHIAVMQGNLEFVQEILKHKGSFYMCLGRDRDGRNPLHLAAMYAKEERLSDAKLRNDTATLSQLPQQDSTRLDIANLKFEDTNALLAAATVDNEAFVQAILQANSSSTCYQMCLARDGDGRNPVHLAAMYGQLKFLNLLLENHDGWLIEAALEKTDREGTILHLCVKHNQLTALKLLLEIFSDLEFVGTKNDDGMTILHLAIYYNQNQSGRREMVTYLIKNTRQEMVNIKNTNGKTALDLVLEQGKIGPSAFLEVKGRKTKLNRLLSHSNVVDLEILRSLAKARALTGYEALSSQEMHTKIVKLLQTRADALMVVASLIATMAFQAMVSPPGGVWQEDSLEGPNPHRAGEAVLAKTHPKYFRHLIRANTVAFVSSLSSIIVLIRGPMVITREWFFTMFSLMMWLSIAAIGITYAISFATVAPGSERGGLTITSAIVVIVIMKWGSNWAISTLWFFRNRRRRRLPSFSF